MVEQALDKWPDSPLRQWKFQQFSELLIKSVGTIDFEGFLC
jgi:hypothetical protein